MTQNIYLAWQTSINSHYYEYFQLPLKTGNQTFESVDRA